MYAIVLKVTQKGTFSHAYLPRKLLIATISQRTSGRLHLISKTVANGYAFILILKLIPFILKCNVTLHYITFYLLVTESRTVSLSYLLIISVSKKLSTDLISLAQAHFVIKLSPVIIKPEAFCNSFMSHFVIKWLSAFRNNICHFDFQQQIALCLMPCTCHAQRVLAFFLTRKSVQLPSF